MLVFAENEITVCVDEDACLLLVHDVFLTHLLDSHHYITYKRQRDSRSYKHDIGFIVFNCQCKCAQPDEC